MHARVGMQHSDHFDIGRLGRRWEDIILAAQLDLADDLACAIGTGRLNQRTYREWMACESALSRLYALALDGLSEWHGAQPTLRAAAQSWSTALRGDALSAAAEARGSAHPDGALSQGALSQLDAWGMFLQSACISARAGEALGAIVLHARLMRGPMREAITAIVALPFAASDGSSYLLQRRQPEAGPEQQGRAALLDAYSATALAAGAQRAADWYRAAMASALTTAPSRGFIGLVG